MRSFLKSIFSPSLSRNRSTRTRKRSRETSPTTRHYSPLNPQPEQIGTLADALQGQLRIGSSEETEGTMRQLLRGLEDRGQLWEEIMIAPTCKRTEVIGLKALPLQAHCASMRAWVWLKQSLRRTTKLSVSIASSGFPPNAKTKAKFVRRFMEFTANSFPNEP